MFKKNNLTNRKGAKNVDFATRGGGVRFLLCFLAAFRLRLLCAFGV